MEDGRWEKGTGDGRTETGDENGKRKSRKWCVVCGVCGMWKRKREDGTSYASVLRKHGGGYVKKLNVCLLYMKIMFILFR